MGGLVRVREDRHAARVHAFIITSFSGKPEPTHVLARDADVLVNRLKRLFDSRVVGVGRLADLQVIVDDLGSVRRYAAEGKRKKELSDNLSDIKRGRGGKNGCTHMQHAPWVGRPPRRWRPPPPPSALP